MIKKFKSISRAKGGEQGYLIILSFIVVFALMGIGLSIAGVLSSQYATTKQNTYVENAVSTAEAGISASLAQLNTVGSSFTGYATRQTLYSDSTRGRSEYTTNVTPNADGTLTITSTAYTYATQSDTNPADSKTVKAIVKGTSQSVKAGVVAGPGGLVTTNGRVMTKYIYVNGQVNVGSSTYLGCGGFLCTNQTDVNVNAANVGCGSGATYPQPCSTQPITIGWNGGIYGTVCATSQTSNANIYSGTSGSGLMTNCTAPAVTMPTYDRSGVYNSMLAANGTKTAASIGACSLFVHNLTIAKNQIYTGDLNVNGNGCTATIKGDMYLTGNLNVTFFANLKVDDALTTPPIIYVDGNVNFNTAGLQKNSSGIGAIVISFKSANSSCDHTCNTLSASDLYNSVNTITAVCSGSFCDMRGSVIYAYFGTSEVTATGSVSGMGGQRVWVDSLSSIVADAVNKTGLQNDDAFGGKTAINSWKIVDYQQVYP